MVWPKNSFEGLEDVKKDNVLKQRRASCYLYEVQGATKFNTNQWTVLLLDIDNLNWPHFYTTLIVSDTFNFAI